MNKAKIICLILVAMVGFFLFYWYQIRPSLIYSRCDTEAKVDAANEQLRKLKLVGMGIKEATSAGILYSSEDYEFAYKYCLRESGLKIL